MSDVQKADPSWNVILLRYFNPVGAHRAAASARTRRGSPTT